MKIFGPAYKFGDSISTDLIISGRYKFAIRDMKELARHLLEDADPKFYQNFRTRPGFIVAGKNFGLGSSREQAPRVIKEAGALAVLAKGFARIFYRNAFNIGLLLVECNTDLIANQDLLELDLSNGLLQNRTRGIKLPTAPLPPVMKKLLAAGGLINYFRRHKELDFGL